MINGLLFWLVLLFLFYTAYVLGARSTMARTAAAAAVPPIIPPEKMVAMESILSPLLVITGRKVVGEVFQFEGRLRGTAEETFRKIREAFRARWSHRCCWKAKRMTCACWCCPGT
jgi:hypothetical protein